MRILGISAFYHDSAAALIEDGKIIAAAQEERFTRKKHDARFPVNAIRCCLSEGGTGMGGVDHVVFYDKPFLKFERLVETYLAFAPRGYSSFRMAMPLWLREKLFLKDLLLKQLRRISSGEEWNEELLFSEHHLSHAASAFFPSPFDEAIVLTMDGVGEWATTSAAIGKGNTLEVRKEIHFPHSLGFLYSAFTYYTGFKVNSGEYKLMGLAPYGEPKHKDKILEHLIDVKADGSFRLNLSYFDFCTGLTMTSRRFHDLFGGPPRKPDQLLTQRHMDLAASNQAATEEIVLRLTRSLCEETGIRNLCLAGGVALNCVANGKILRDERGGPRPLEGARLVPGPNGVRPQGARQPLDIGRPALAHHAEDAQSQDQVSRVLPAVRALGAARAGERLVRDGLRQPVHAAGRRRGEVAAPRDDAGGEAALRDRQAQRPALGDSGRHPRRLLGPRADGARGHQSALPRVALCV